MAVARRFGLESSKTRAMLLDAAEQLMCEEGYAAVTSRRVASRAGLKPQLVHYYFRTMDDLFLALLRRGFEQSLEHHRQIFLASDQSLRALWERCLDPQNTTLIMEFSALANHRKAIRAEIANFGERLRELQTQALSRVLTQGHVDSSAYPPIVLAMLMTSVSRVLVLEAALGMSSGHAETLAFVERHLQQFEQGRQAASGL